MKRILPPEKQGTPRLPRQLGFACTGFGAQLMVDSPTVPRNSQVTVLFNVILRLIADPFWVIVASDGVGAPVPIQVGP